MPKQRSHVGALNKPRKGPTGIRHSNGVFNSLVYAAKGTGTIEPMTEEAAREFVRTTAETTHKTLTKYPLWWLAAHATRMLPPHVLEPAKKYIVKQGEHTGKLAFPILCRIEDTLHHNRDK